MILYAPLVAVLFPNNAFNAHYPQRHVATDRSRWAEDKKLLTNSNHYEVNDPMHPIFLMVFIFVIPSINASLLSDEQSTNVAVTADIYKQPEEVRGKHYYIFSSSELFTVDDVNLIAKIAENEYFKSTGIKADLKISIQDGIERRRRIDGQPQRPNSKYIITIQHIEKYIDGVRPLSSSIGTVIELDEKFSVIPFLRFLPNKVMQWTTCQSISNSPLR